MFDRLILLGIILGDVAFLITFIHFICWGGL